MATLVRCALALVAAGALFSDRAVIATSCALCIAGLDLVSVTEDGIPVAGSYDAQVSIRSRPGGVQVNALQAIPGGTAFWREDYHVAPAPSP